jgi:GT2 family glycosyltransferase
MEKKYNIIGSIVLFNNNIPMLEKAINSFLNTKLKVKLFLIDNSPSNDLEVLSKISPNIEYIFNNENVGFGAGHNIAIKKSLLNSDYYLVLNPDIEYEEGNIEKMFDFMEANKNVGQMMPKVLYPDGKLQYLCKKNPKPLDLVLRRFCPEFIQSFFSKRMSEYEYRDRDHTKIMFDIPYLSGCFMFFRTTALQQIGLFDDRIFMYIEDADITRRVLKIAKTAYYPDAIVYHNFEKGSYKNWKLTWYAIHGAIVYFNKWGWL